MRWLRLFLLSCLLCFLSQGGYAQESSSSVRERMQTELLNLKVQLINCGRAINSLKSDIAQLKQIVTVYEQTTNDLEEQLKSLEEELQTRTELYVELSKQATALSASLRKLETEKTLLWVGIGVTGAAAIAATIWALSK